MKDLVLEEASVVDVPADPLARQTKLEITHANLRELLRAAFTPGIALNCDHCLEPYHGLPKSLDIAGLSGEKPAATELPHPRPAAPKSPPVHATPEDLERFGDEEQVRAAWDEGRLRDEQPPHHH
jgi:hypothetical protein